MSGDPSGGGPPFRGPHGVGAAPVPPQATVPDRAPAPAWPAPHAHAQYPNASYPAPAQYPNAPYAAPSHPAQHAHPAHAQYPNAAYPAPSHAAQHAHPAHPGSGYAHPNAQQHGYAAAQHAQHGAFQHRPREAPLPGAPAPDRHRLRVGLVLWVLGLVAGVVLNVFFTFLEIAMAPDPGRVASAMVQGAIPAFAMLLVYLPIPAVLDRYDPEPWWALTMAFLWGAFVATGFAGMFNTAVQIVATGAFGEPAGRFIMTVFAAPFSEEIMKGLAIWGFFYFLRREFDGVVDGIVYATFCALGFAAVENVQYYARAALESQESFSTVFVLRGIVAPWGHPLYTSMTGLGFGIARETSSPFWRKAAPVVGLGGGMFLHAVWNFVPNLGAAVFVLSLLLWFVFIAAFAVIIVMLVVRKGRIIADHLKDEILFGTLTQQEFALVTSAFGGIRSYFLPKGSAWRRLMRASARLALSKWHTARAMKGQKRTFSVEFIGPLREEIRKARAEIAAP